MAGNDIRNIALVGHGRSGKTTLSEAVLFAAKVVNRQGTNGDKNTVSDFADDERERGHSIDASLIHAKWKGKDFNIVDAPGYPDFVGQALRGLYAVDCAVIVIHAYDGVLLNTRRLYKAAGDRGIPRIVVVYRCDAENIDLGVLGKALDDLCGTAGKAVTVPDAFGHSVKRVRSVFGDAAADLKEGFVEAAVEADDALMEKYLESGEVSDEDLHRAIPMGLQKGTLVPIFHPVADKGLGVPELLDFIAEYGPSPVGRSIEDADGNAIACVADAPLRALCFKVMYERQAGRIAFLRVFSGSLRPGDTAVLARTEEPVKIGHLSRFQGPQKAEVPQAGIGDIVALPKVDNVTIGDTLHATGHPVKIRVLPLPKPMVGLAVQPKARGDETKLARELDRITGADPCLEAERVAATNELVVRGLSILHLDIALKRA